MNKELSDVIKDARYSLIARLAVGSLWAPLLWLAVMALGDVPNFESEVGARVQTLNGFGLRVNEPFVHHELDRYLSQRHGPTSVKNRSFIHPAKRNRRG